MWNDPGLGRYAKAPLIPQDHTIVIRWGHTMSPHCEGKTFPHWLWGKTREREEAWSTSAGGGEIHVETDKSKRKHPISSWCQQWHCGNTPSWAAGTQGSSIYSGPPNFRGVGLSSAPATEWQDWHFGHVITVLPSWIWEGDSHGGHCVQQSDKWWARQFK